MADVIEARRKETKDGRRREKVRNAETEFLYRIQAELTEILLDPPCGIIAAPKGSNRFDLFTLSKRTDMSGRLD